MVSFAALVIWEGNIYTFAEALVKKVYSQTMLPTWEEWNPKNEKDTHMFLFQKFSNKKAPVRALSTYYRKEKEKKKEKY